MRRILLGCPPESTCDMGHRGLPEVRTVVSQLGRPDDGTDPSGFQNIELFAPLEPPSSWRRGVTKDGLTAQLSRDLRETFPGVDFNFSQYIADNVEEAMSGVKGENTVKVVGPDLRFNEEKAAEIARVLQRVRGVEDLGVFRTLGQPDIRRRRRIHHLMLACSHHIVDGPAAGMRTGIRTSSLSIAGVVDVVSGSS